MDEETDAGGEEEEEGVGVGVDVVGDEEVGDVCAVVVIVVYEEALKTVHKKKKTRNA